MKKSRIFTAIAVFALAIGTAIGSQGDEIPSNAQHEANEATVLELAHYRTIPNDPSSCEEFMEVDCTPVQTTTLCTWEISGTEEQLYDINCQPLYKQV